MPSADVPDEDLVLRARNGDEDAFAVLFRRHAERLAVLGRRRLLGRMRRRTGDSDLVQLTMQAAFRALDRYEPAGPGSFARWLDAIFEHKARDLTRRDLRARRTVRHEAGGVSGIQTPAAGPTPSSLVGRGERSNALRAAIRRLEGDDRVVLALVHERGMSFEEAGRVIGRSSEATRKHYARVVARLGRSLRKETP